MKTSNEKVSRHRLQEHKSVFNTTIVSFQDTGIVATKTGLNIYIGIESNEFRLSSNPGQIYLHQLINIIESSKPECVIDSIDIIYFGSNFKDKTIFSTEYIRNQGQKVVGFSRSETFLRISIPYIGNGFNAKYWTSFIDEDNSSRTEIKQNQGKGFWKLAATQGKRILFMLHTMGISARVLSGFEIKNLRNEKLKNALDAYNYGLYVEDPRDDSIKIREYLVEDSNQEIFNISSSESIYVLNLKASTTRNKYKTFIGCVLFDRAKSNLKQPRGWQLIKGKNRGFLLEHLLPQVIIGSKPIAVKNKYYTTGMLNSISMPAYGLGVYLGKNQKGLPLYLNMRETKSSLYVVAPEIYLWQLIGRLSVNYNISIDFESDIFNENMNSVYASKTIKVFDPHADISIRRINDHQIIGNTDNSKKVTIIYSNENLDFAPRHLLRLKHPNRLEFESLNYYDSLEWSLSDFETRTIPKSLWSQN